MNYVDTPKHSFFAAATAFAVTLAVTSGIVFGLAGVPQDNAANMANRTPVQTGLTA